MTRKPYSQFVYFLKRGRGCYLIIHTPYTLMNIQAARVGLVTARTVNFTDLQMFLQGADRQMAMPTMYAFIAHASLGPSWAVLGPSWGRLRAPLGRLGAILGACRASWTPAI